MLDLMLRSALLGVVLAVGLVLVIGYATVIAWALLAIVVAVVAVAVIGARYSRAAPRRPLPTEPDAAPHENVTLTSTPVPVRATSRENLASDNRWRRAFDGWRYRTPPKG